MCYSQECPSLSPRPMACVSAFNQTMQTKFFDTAMHKKLYSNLEELQGDRDAWLVYHNEESVHSDRYCYGKTPLKTLIDSKGLALEKSNELMFYKEKTYSQELADKNIA